MRQIEELYNNYSKDIFNYLCWLTHKPSVAEDLLQETFLKAIYAINNFRGESTIRTWLFSIARHVWLQYLRKNNIDVQDINLISIDADIDIEENFNNKEIVQKIYDLLSEKEERVQEIFRLRMKGFSYAEISDLLHVSENSARVMDFRTKKWLRSILEKEEYI